jgi:hypothetical protein
MTGDGDELERSLADSLFIRERLRALDADIKRDAKATEDAYRRIMLDLLRSRTPSRHTLNLVAGELERLWWPKAYKKQRRRGRKLARLSHADALQDYLADRYRKKGARDPRTRAEKLTARALGIGVAGLRQRRVRYRKVAKT